VHVPYANMPIYRANFIKEHAMSFKNQTILITGATSGLGKTLAIDLSYQGANLILAGRDVLALNETALQCQNKSYVIPTDVTAESDCRNLMTEAIKHVGQIDYLILNAGISMWSTFESLADLSMTRQLMETNYFGAINCVHYALPHLKISQGMIVVISSVQGKFGVPYHSGYAASKHALQGFFDTLRMEIKKDNIDVLMVLPGWIRGTSLKQRALKNTTVHEKVIDPSVHKKHNRLSSSINDCSKDIISAMSKRKREILIPRTYKALLWLKLLFPKWLDILISKNIE